MVVTIMFNVRNVTADYLLTNETIGEDTNKYQIIIDRIQFFMTVIGFLGNITVYVTLLKNGNIVYKSYDSKASKKPKYHRFNSLFIWRNFGDVASNADNCKRGFEWIFLYGKFHFCYHYCSKFNFNSSLQQGDRCICTL